MIETGQNLLLENIYNVLIFGSILIIGLILARFLNLNLRIYQGVYLFLGAANVLIYYFKDENIIFPLIALAIGEIVMVLFLGIIGNKLSSKNYAAILFAVGLFPWGINLNSSILYAVLLVVLTIGYSYLKNYLGFKSIGKRMSDPQKAVVNMKEKDKEIFREKATAKFATPFMVAAILTFIEIILTI